MNPGIQEWFASRLPAHWHARGLEILSDQDEILVVVDLPPDTSHVDSAHTADSAHSAGSDHTAHTLHADTPHADTPHADTATGERGGERSPDSQDLTGVRWFRESTRDERMVLAEAAEQAFGRKISWGARTGGVAVIFTTASLPVMTRLRLPERRVLDTLIDAGVARSRSEALAWCVRLVGDNEKEWISELRHAFQAVEAARERGPRSRRKPPPGPG